MGNGGPAFPIQKEMLSTKIGQGHLSEITTIPGMTLRDYFAAKAMQGICANSEIEKSGKNSINCRWLNGISAVAYTIADAMIEERKMEEQTKNNGRLQKRFND